jgi:hypothetical protein
MPDDGPADGNKVARFAVDFPRFSRWLSSARWGQSRLSDPESPNVDKSLKKSDDLDNARVKNQVLQVLLAQAVAMEIISTLELSCGW